MSNEQYSDQDFVHGPAPISIPENLSVLESLVAEDEPDYETRVQQIQETFGPRIFKRYIPESQFPEMFVTIPDDFETVQLAPLYDVHIGSREHDEALFERHLDWIAETPNVFTWNGGDIIENITPGSAYMGNTRIDPEEQQLLATEKLARIQHKMLFSMPGNHEDRTRRDSGMSSGRRIADNLQLPYFSDYAFVTIRWRNNNFRILAHHGAGGGTTPGAQRNSARKEIAWAKPDLLWTGHLHQPLVDTVQFLDVDQRTGELFERNMLVMISPSYLRYFGGYAAKKRLGPGARGLSVAILNADGRIDANVHANGKRL